MKKVSYLLTLLSGAIFLLTLNRKTNLSQGLLEPYGFLRWQDFHAMVSLPLIITIIYALMFLHITNRQPKIHNKFGIFLLIFVTGALLYGVSSGNHEITNYLHHRYCMQDNTSLCQIINYHDDTFSHFIFYVSSILMTISLLFFEKDQPESSPISKSSMTLLCINSLVIGLGLFANLAFEKLGIDLYAFGILSAISLSLLWIIRKNFRVYPIILYCALGYGSGTLASILAKLIIR